jgi:hypothetical protein
MILNFVFSNGLVYFFILILKEIIFLNPTICHMLEQLIVIYATRFCVNWAFLIARGGQIEIRA